MIAASHAVLRLSSVAGLQLLDALHLRGSLRLVLVEIVQTNIVIASNGRAPSICKLIGTRSRMSGRRHSIDSISQCYTGPAGQKELYLVAEALSQAALSMPAIYDTLTSAYAQAVLGQFTINTPTSIQVATAALAALRSAQQPLMVQVNHQSP